MRPSHRRRNPAWVAGPKGYRRSAVTTVRVTDIIKELYPQHRIGGGPVMERSWAAKLARERHWITWDQYFKFPLVDTGRRERGFVYAPFPLIAMLKKDTSDWSQPKP